MAYVPSHVSNQASADVSQDLEMNRFDPNKKSRGMFVKTPKKKAKVRPLTVMVLTYLT